MTAQQDPPSGPDLSNGCPSADIPEGAMLVGHIGDDAILLTRQGGRCFAVGAKCTHYGGPLGEGLIVDGVVRCPWHHAAFRLDSGEAVRGPAFDPIPCWRVEESGGAIRVAERQAPSAPRATRATIDVGMVIVGAGAAGIAAADTLRKEGFQGRVTLVDRDPAAPVDRPNLSKDYLAGSAPEEWLTLRDEGWFAERDITLVRARATALDVTRKTLDVDGGAPLKWDALLLATGATPVPPALAAQAHLPLLTLRSLADCRAIIAAADLAGAGATVVLLGASFIALEVAASLRARGLEVHVVAPNAVPLEKALGTDVGRWIQQIHESHGVVFHMGQSRRVLHADAVEIGDGVRIPAAFVVAGIGVRPDTELAARAGLTVDKGIIVDAQLRTTARGVYAAGDAVRYPDPRGGGLVSVEHWVAAQRQGQTAARNMIGGAEPFTAVPFFWSAHYDVTLSYIGHAEQWDKVEIDGSLEGRDAEVRYSNKGRLAAVATVGRDRVLLEREVAMERVSG